MSTLAEIEKAIPKLTIEELAELEKSVRQAMREKVTMPAPSVFDMKPLHLGKTLSPLGSREDWYDEMLEGRI